MSAKIDVQIRLDGNPLEQANSVLQEIVESESWLPDFAFYMGLIIEELLLNVVSYAKFESDPDIRLSLASDDDGAVLVLSDNGTEFDPFQSVAEPDLDAPVSERAVGGLGVYFVEQIADDVEYNRENGRNKVTIMKKRERQ